MKLLWYLIYLLCLCSVQSTKLLMENPGFDDPKTWISEYMPCAAQKVVFPTNYGAVLPLPQEVNVAGFVLPHNGAILLQQEGSIDLGNTNKNNRPCQKGVENKSFLTQPSTKKWFNADNWLTVPNKLGQNTAIPHLNRIPCDNEAVIINSKGPLSIDLEKVNFLRLGQLIVAGTLITKEYLQHLLTTQLGRLLFKNSEDVSVEYYRNDVCGCHRDSKYLIEPICNNIHGQCPIPLCLAPIVPLGGCCAICGGMLNYQVSNCNTDQLQKVRKFLTMKLKEHQLEDKIDSDVNFYNNNNYGKYLQIIVVDREEYNELSVKFLQNLNSTKEWHKLLVDSHLIREAYAGRYYNPNITLFSIFLIIFCILLVFLVSLIIFAHYQPNHEILQHVPTWLYNARRWRSFAARTQMMFARFDQHNERLVSTSGAQDIDDGSNSRAIGYNADSGVVQERSFDNPMFGIQPKIDKKSLPVLETGSLADTTFTEGNAEIQELQEIKLDTLSVDGADTEEESLK